MINRVEYLSKGPNKNFQFSPSTTWQIKSERIRANKTALVISFSNRPTVGGDVLSVSYTQWVDTVILTSHKGATKTMSFINFTTSIITVVSFPSMDGVGGDTSS